MTILVIAFLAFILHLQKEIAEIYNSWRESVHFLQLAFVGNLSVVKSAIDMLPSPLWSLLARRANEKVSRELRESLKERVVYSALCATKIRRGLLIFARN